MDALFDVRPMSQRAYIKWCMRSGLAEEVYNAEYPHPYIVLWLECRRHSNAMGVAMYPEPEKGYMDQDAELMLAFEVLDECWSEREKAEDSRQRAKQIAAERANQMFG